MKGARIKHCEHLIGGDENSRERPQEDDGVQGRQLSTRRCSSRFCIESQSVLRSRARKRLMISLLVVWSAAAKIRPPANAAKTCAAVTPVLNPVQFNFRACRQPLTASIHFAAIASPFNSPYHGLLILADRSAPRSCSLGMINNVGLKPEPLTFSARLNQTSPA